MCELALQSRTGIMEHPAEPEATEAPSVWKLPVVQVLVRMPGREKWRLAQGLLGASSPKPTELLVLNMPSLPAAICQWRLTPEVPRSGNIGTDHKGQYRTAHLKEYPPAFCAAMAQATAAAISHEPTGVVQIEPSFLAQSKAMDQDMQCRHIGPDFAQR